MIINWQNPTQAISTFQDYWENTTDKLIKAFENENEQSYKAMLEQVNQDLDFKVFDFLLSASLDLRNVELVLIHLLDYFWGRVELSQSSYLLSLYQQKYMDLKKKQAIWFANPYVDNSDQKQMNLLQNKSAEEFEALALKFEESLCRLASEVIYQGGIDFVIALNKQILFLTGEFSFCTPGIQADWEYFRELLDLSQREGIFSLEDIEIPLAFDFLKKPIKQIVEGLSPENLHFILTETFSKSMAELESEEKIFLTGLVDIQQGKSPYILKAKMASIIGMADNRLEIKETVPIVDDLLLDSPEKAKKIGLKELAEHFLFWAERARKEGLSSLEYYLQSIYFTDDIEVLFTALLNGMAQGELEELTRFIFLVRKNQQQLELKFWHLALLLLQHPQASFIAREINFFVQEMSLACKKNAEIKLDHFENQNIGIKLLQCQYENRIADFNLLKSLLFSKLTDSNTENFHKPEWLRMKLQEKQNWQEQKKDFYKNLVLKKEMLIKIQARKNPALETLEFLLDKNKVYPFTRALIDIYLKKEKQKGDLLNELSIQSRMEISQITEEYLGKAMKMDGRDAEVTILRQMIQTGLLPMDAISQLPHKERLHFLREFFYLQGANEDDPLELKKAITPSDFSYLALALKDCDDGIQSRIFEVLNDEEIRLIKSTMEYI